MRTILKIIAAPFILALILAVAVLSFLSCVAGAVCVVACVGLSLLAILCLLAGQTTGCIAMFVLAFLVSPFGLPALGGWLVERLYGGNGPGSGERGPVLSDPAGVPSRRGHAGGGK